VVIEPKAFSWSRSKALSPTSSKRGDEVGRQKGSEPDEGGLVEPQGLDVVEAIWMVDQGRPVSQHSSRNNLAVTPEIPGDLVDASAVLSNRSRGEAACSIGQGQARMGDLSRAKGVGVAPLAIVDMTPRSESG
jgi:hypothetical protein